VLQCVTSWCRAQLSCDLTHVTCCSAIGRLRLVGSIELQVSFAEYSLFYTALLQKRHITLSILLTKATPYGVHETNSVLQCVALFHSVLQCVVVYCCVLQCVARVLQCVVVHEWHMT